MLRRVYLVLGPTPTSLTLMFVFLGSPDVNTAVASAVTDGRKPDRDEVFLSDVFLLHVAPRSTLATCRAYRCART